MDSHGDGATSICNGKRGPDVRTLLTHIRLEGPDVEGSGSAESPSEVEDLFALPLSM